MFVYYIIIINTFKNINTLNFFNTWIIYYHISMQVHGLNDSTYSHAILPMKEQEEEMLNIGLGLF